MFMKNIGAALISGIKKIGSGLVQVPVVATVNARVQADPVLAIVSFLAGALVAALLGRWL